MERTKLNDRQIVPPIVRSTHIEHNFQFPGTAGIVVPSGTTNQRPEAPSNGTIRINTTTGSLEAYTQGWGWWNMGRAVGKSVVATYSATMPAATGTSTVPYDNTVPLITEGTQVMSIAVTPFDVGSSFNISVPFTVDCNTASRFLILSAFAGTVNIGSIVVFSTATTRPQTGAFILRHSPGSTAPVTYSIRIGIGGGAGSWFFNRTAGANNLGTSLLSEYIIDEVV